MSATPPPPKRADRSAAGTGRSAMPVAFLRLAVSKMRLPRDMSACWKFSGGLPVR